MKKILLADDSITIQKVVELTFSEGDFQVVCVSNGAQALKKTADLLPDLVLLDVIMPEKNGYEVCELLKRNPLTSGIPVLLLTGTFEPFDKKRAEAIGADGHLTKPFESQALVSKVEALIAARPTVVSRERAGVMDIIAGGEVRRFDPDAPPADPRGGRPEVPPASAAPGAAAMGGVDGFAMAAQPVAPAGEAWPTHAVDMSPAPWPEDAPEPETPHPALVPPDASLGGSYVGFADLAPAGEEGGVVPDRFDSMPSAPTSTVRMSREDLMAGTGPSPASGPPAARPQAPAEAPAASSPMEGFTGGYDLPPSEGRTLPAGERVPDPGPAPHVRAASPEPGAPAGPSALTPEAVDRIAEEVVRRISDRVVREIAWEVIPQVAEILVSRRIKELEESGG